MAAKSAPRNIDDNIPTFAPEVQAILPKIRRTIREATPEAEETISYLSFVTSSISTPNESEILR